MRLTFQEFLDRHRFHSGELEATGNPETGLISVPCGCGCRWLGMDLRSGMGVVEEAAG